MTLLRKSLNTVEYLETFSSFVAAGIEHIKLHGGTARDGGDANRLEKVELSVDAISRMQDVLLDLEEISKGLETGLKDLTFSTVSEDYVEGPAAL